MNEGLEFLKSWRFWASLTALTSAITLGGAGVYIASVLYFPQLAGEPIPLFPLLAGYAPVFLAGGVCWLFYRRDDRAHRYHKEHGLPVVLGTVLATALVVLPVVVSVHWLIVEPIVPDAPGSGIYRSSGFLFGVIFGPLIASVEGAAMSDADAGASQSTNSDSP